jgi:nitroreductase
MAEIASLDALGGLMARQRAVREFTNDPVDDGLIERLLEAATRAPSAKNEQVLRFVVVKRPETKQQVAAIVGETPGPGRTPWDEVPVLVFVCAANPFGETATGAAAQAGSVYPGIQNLLLAARSAGLGTVLTTSRAKIKEAELRALLNLPQGTDIYAIIPMGWPVAKIGKNRRRPVSEVAYRERFGDAW